MYIKIPKSIMTESISEESIFSSLVNEYGIDKATATDKILDMDFSSYVKLEKALENDDRETIASMFSVVTEEDNPYAITMKNTNAVSGSDVNTDNEDDKVHAVVDVTDKVGDETDGDETDGDNIDEELSRLKTLAGIEETASCGVISSGAMAGVMMPMNKLKKLTHTNKKPGPKLGSKNEKKKSKK